MLQHEINKAKEGYQALLQSMQDLKVEEKVQQEKVQKLQKTLHERVADGEEESTCEELDLQAAMTSAGVDLTKEQKEALARALGQKPVKVAFAFGLDAAKPIVSQEVKQETTGSLEADPRRGIEWRTRKQAGRDGLTPKNLGIGIKGPLLRPTLGPDHN